MRKSTNGFTIVELLVVVAIIGILSTIGVFSYSRIQANTRDSERSSKTTIIAEALEKYYDQNGEYPGCLDMTKTASEVAANLGNIDPNVLKTPSAALGVNSILPNCSNELTAGTDAVAYVGDGSVACNTGQTCLEWKLQYYEEGTGNIISISSRRNTVISTSGVATLTATENGFTQIDLTWTPVNNATNYTVERATNSAFSTGLTSVDNTETSISILELTPGVKYYFRVRANALSSSGNWSAPANATTLTLLPLVAIVTANSTSQITVDWGTVTNADTYSVSRSLSSDMSASTTVAGLTNTLYVATGLSANTTYYFQVTAIAGGLSSYSNKVPKATLHLATPAVTATVNSTTQITISWAAITYRTSYTAQRSTSSSFTSPTIVTGLTSTSQVFTGLTPGTTYYFRVQALNANDTSSWSTTDTSTTSINAPAAPAINAVISGSNAVATVSSVSCASGTTTEYQTQKNTNDGTWSAWTTWATGAPTVTVAATEGYKYGFGVHAHCSGVSVDSSSSATNTDTVIRSVSAPTLPTISAVMSGSNAVGTAGAVSCAAGTTTIYQVAHNENGGSGIFPGWTGNTAIIAASQGSNYGFSSWAYCDGAYADSAAVGGTYADTTRPIDTPAAPTYTYPGAFQSGVAYAIGYQGYCPAGTNTINATFHTRAWTGALFGPHPWGYGDSWDWDRNLTSDKNVEYWGSYQCQTPWATSPMSPESYNVWVVHNHAI